LETSRAAALPAVVPTWQRIESTGPESPRKRHSGTVFGVSSTKPPAIGQNRADESACKPDPVPRAPRGAPLGGHPSRPAVADRLVRPTRRHRAGSPRTPAQVPKHPLGLAPGGVYLAAPVARGAGGLLHHRFTLTPARTGAVCSLWHCPEGRPWLPLTTTLPCGVRTFLGDRHEFCRRGRPADSSAPPG
jgi:hypothetical protein